MTYNLETSSYETGTSLPLSVYQYSVCKRESTNVLYFSGGVWGTFRKDVYSYNLESKIFTALSQKMITPRAHHCSQIYEDGTAAKLVVAGGFTTGWGWTNTLETCDISSSSGTCSSGQPVPTVNKWACLTMDDAIHAFNSGTALLYKYEPRTGQWIQRHIQSNNMTIAMKSNVITLNIEDLLQHCQLI